MPYKLLWDQDREDSLRGRRSSMEASCGRQLRLNKAQTTYSHAKFAFAVQDNTTIMPLEDVNPVPAKQLGQLSSIRRNARAVVICGSIIRIILSQWKQSLQHSCVKTQLRSTRMNTLPLLKRKKKKILWNLLLSWSTISRIK